MEFFDVLPVRFHFNGEFVRDSNDLFYVGGTQAMSYIDRDKLSLPKFLVISMTIAMSKKAQCCIGYFLGEI
ncbi:hypothetical protein BDA96_03G466400 [Sorghum bicolor]|uniref:Uncharacterized protein n=1 Tax=Sorghum bicolor TaxID=4558 RepID=A0A921RIU1_SORBI|nr:hypothetical protein BDA96_03G466400 [Sorghum bicolor]